MTITMTLPSTYTSSNRFAALSPKLSSPSPPPVPAPNSKKKRKPRIPSAGSNALSGSTGPSSISSSSSSLSELAAVPVAVSEKKTKRTLKSKAREPSPVRTQVAEQQGPPAPVSVRTKKAKSAKTTVKQAATPPIDWEIPRKTLHASIGVLVLALNDRQPRTLNPLLRVLVTGLVAVFTVDIVRLRSKAFATLYERHLGALMRESEKTQINGVIWYLVGVIFTLAAYPRDVAVVAILTLSWSDTTASTIGRLWGRYTAPLPDHLWGVPALKFAKRKSLAGFLAAVATGFAIGVGFYGLSAAGDKAYATWAVLHGKHTVWGVLGTSAVIGVGGAVVEALDLGFDDNLTLPILSGAVVWAWFAITNFALAL